MYNDVKKQDHYVLSYKLHNEILSERISRSPHGNLFNPGMHLDNDISNVFDDIRHLVVSLLPPSLCLCCLTVLARHTMSTLKARSAASSGLHNKAFLRLIEASVRRWPLHELLLPLRMEEQWLPCTASPIVRQISQSSRRHSFADSRTRIQCRRGAKAMHHATYISP